MRKVWAILIALGMICSFSSVCFAQDLKIGYVDVLKIFSDYKKTKKYDKELEKKGEAAKKKLEAKLEIVNGLKSKLSVVKEDEKDKEEANLVKEAKEYDQLLRKADFDIRKERDEKMREILEDIDKIIKDYSEKNGFDLVVDERAVLYGAKGMDITDEILKIANKKFRKK